MKPLRNQTVNLARLGYWNGDGKRLREFLVEQQIDPECPAAVALLGLSRRCGGVGQTLAVSRLAPDWLRDGEIRGMPAGMLIYPFIEAGRVTYLAGRGTGARSGTTTCRWNWSAIEPLYFNHVWTPQAKRVVIVEGQADAITLARWGSRPSRWSGPPRRAAGEDRPTA